MAGARLRGWFAQYRTLFLLSSLHALLLVLLTFWWMQLHWQFGDELIVARVNQISKYLLFNSTDPITADLKKKLLLVNCSYDKMLVPFSDDFGDGTKAVVDRPKLTQFFNLVNKASVKPKLVVVDILFDYPSDYDSAMYVEAKKIQRAVFSSEKDEQGNISKPVEGLHYSLAQYSTTDIFLKYSILTGLNKTVPASMYEITEGDQFKKQWGLTRSMAGTWMNTSTVDMAIRQAQISGSEEGIVLWNLGEAIKVFSPEELQNEIANKIIVIGDFYEFDIHETLLGPQPGPLILVNSYLSLLRGVPITGFVDVGLIFLLYFFTTLYVIRVKHHKENEWRSRAQTWWASRFLVKYFSYLLIFSCFTVLFYIVTLKHFQLVLFAFYFNLFEWGVLKFQHLKSQGPVIEANND